MQNNCMKKNNNKSDENSINPVLIGIMGGVLGAGIAVATAVAMKDEKNKERLKEVLMYIKDQALEYADTHKNHKGIKEGIKKLKSL